MTVANPLLPLALLLTTVSPILALDCATAPDRTSGPGWRYRIIESRQCWYRNETPMLKSDLHWAAGPVVESLTVDAPLSPVLVRTVVYRSIERADDDSPWLALFIMWFGFIAVIAGVIAGMIAVWLRGRA